METTGNVRDAYTSILNRYCVDEDTALLAQAAALGELFIAAQVDPMEIKALHDDAISTIPDEDTRAQVAAHRLLLEVLLAYGAAYSALSVQMLAEADAAATAHAEDTREIEERRLEFLAGVTHELGNPLMVVKVNVASIRRSLEERGSWPEDLDQREADVTFAVDRMISLRDQLLAASRNERPELEIVELPLIRVLSRVVRWARPGAADKRIEITEDYPAELPYVIADDGALQSILGNLLSNAVRYTASGGSIAVSAHREGSTAVVRVADTGMGISDDDMLRIYERFYRTDAAKAVEGGIGLGLAITRDLVSSLGGTIHVRSEVGVGTTFSVSLPASVAEAPV